MIGNKLEPFKFWCQKVLPNVYDDSLSYYEYLCKLNEYLNEVIGQINTLTDNMEDYEADLTATWLETKEYIDNYFNNLNVQQEINNKLDAMAESGELSILLAPIVGTQIGGVVADQIGATVANQIGNTVASQIDATVAGQIDEPVATATATWLASHITPTEPTIDSTLSVSGAGADAKVTGELIRGQYDSTATYKEGELVLYGGKIYVCLTDISTAEAWDSTHWARTNVNEIFYNVKNNNVINGELSKPIYSHKNVVTGITTANTYLYLDQKFCESVEYRITVESNISAPKDFTFATGDVTSYIDNDIATMNVGTNKTVFYFKPTGYATKFVIKLSYGQAVQFTVTTEYNVIPEINNRTLLSNKLINDIALRNPKNINYTVESGYMQITGEMDTENYYHTSISVTAGKIYTIRSRSGSILKPYIFIENGNLHYIIDFENWNIKHDYDIYFIPETNGTLYVNSIYEDYIGVKEFEYYYKNEYEVETNLQTDGIKWKTLSNGTATTGTFYKANVFTLESGSANNYGYYKIEVKPNKIYKVIGYSDSYANAWILTDEYDNVLMSADTDVNHTGYYLTGKVFKAPTNAKYLYLNCCTQAKVVIGTGSNVTITNSYGAIVCEEDTETTGLTYSGSFSDIFNRPTDLCITPVNSTAYVTHVIGVTKGEKYYVRSSNYYNLVAYAYIDDYGNEISSSRGSSAPTDDVWVSKAIDIVKDGYLICSGRTNGMDGIQVSKVKDNSLFGKKWYAIGDSFTEQHNGEPNKWNYVDYCANYFGLEVTNVGVGGTGYGNASGNVNNLYMNKALGCSGYDLVTIFGSFNDSATDLPLGTENDTGTTTLAGLMYNAINNVRETEDGATIVVIAPAPWISQNSVTGNAWGTINPNDYVDMLAKICKKYNVCFVNPYSEGGACPWKWNTGSGSSDFDPTYLYDRTHYNSAGQKKFIAPLVADGLLKAFRQF